MNPSSLRLKVVVLREPKLEFGKGVVESEPKVGLGRGGPFSLKYGPGFPGAVRLGIVGPPAMIDAARMWFERCASGILSGKENRRRHPDFPPFQTLFGSPLELSDRWIVEIGDSQLLQVLSRPPHQQFERLLECYEEGIARLAGRELGPNVIICTLSDDLLKRFRDWRVPGADRSRRRDRPNSDAPRQLSLLSEDDDLGWTGGEVLVYRSFRRALKARAMARKVPIQLAHNHLFQDAADRDDPATRAWDVCVALLYKAGGTPWRLHDSAVRTCFVGVSFHELLTTRRSAIYSSMAQAFASEIEGFVLRGEPIPWDLALGRTPYLNREQARRLGQAILDEYGSRTEQLPLRMVVHKRSKFNEEERDGFSEAFSDVPEVEFVVLLPSSFELLPNGDYPPRRGTLVVVNGSAWYLRLVSSSRGGATRARTYRSRLRCDGQAAVILIEPVGNSSASPR